MNKIFIIIGTRPEAIKIAPLVIEMRKRNIENTQIALVSTHQHDTLMGNALEAFNLKADIEFDYIHYASLEEMQDGIKERLFELFIKEKPTLVVVHGDTTSAWAGAQAAKEAKIKIAHVEAGLRSGDLRAPFPEEGYRRSIDSLAELLFAPTELAKENLIKEGRDENNIFVTGNTGIDSLAYTVKDSYESELLKIIGGKPFVLLTCHRRESQGRIMEKMFCAIARVMQRHKEHILVFPMHPTPYVRKAASFLAGIENVILTEPIDTLECHNLIASAKLVLTDSGGIQEEAAALHTPTLVLRDKTERQEGIASGALRLIGTDEEIIEKEFENALCDEDMLSKMREASNPFGDGRASEAIADILLGRDDIGFCDVAGLKIADISFEKALETAVKYAKSGEFRRICTINAEIAWQCINDKALFENVMSADLVLADGQGVVDGAKKCKNPLRYGKCAGVDLAIELLKAKSELRFYFLGTSDENLQKAKEKAEEKYGAKIVASHNGFFKKVGKESDDVIKNIEKSKPNVVFVCLGAPCQEEWIYQNKEKLPKALYIGLGGTLDVISENVKRAPEIFIKLHLEWFWRLCCNPKRFKRMSVIPKFLYKCKKIGKEKTA